MKLKAYGLFFIISVFVTCSLVFCFPAIAKNTIKRILIIPFDIHSDRDMSFLRDGLTDMLSTRLTVEDKVLPISKEETWKAVKDLNEPMTKKTAIALGKKLKADYVLFGSVTVLGDSISTDGKLYDLRKEKYAATLYEVGKDNSDVIFHVNNFAEKINDKVFGRETTEGITVTPQAPASSDSDEVTDDSSRRHPELMWTEIKEKKEKKRIASSAIPLESDKAEKMIVRTVPTAPTAPVRPAKDISMTGGLRRTQNFEIQIIDIAIGDTDGNGNNEVVFISDNAIFIYRYDGKLFKKIKEIDVSRFDSLLAVDMADINQNGKSEIFVTNMNKDAEFLKSFVLEWNGQDFVEVETKSKWYYRVIDAPGKGKILIGQKRGIRDIFLPGIYEMRWQNGSYEPFKEQILPLWINVFSFTYGNLFNTGKEMIAAFAPNDYLRVLNRDGSEQWRSAENFGGSTTYIDFPDESAASIGTYKETHRYYLAQPLYIIDTDRDGKNELVVVKNKDSSNRLFSKIRWFKSGYITCLAWDDFGFYEKWKTREISGYISDYIIGDFDNDGENELIFSVVTSISSMFDDDSSFIGVQEFLGQ